MAPAGRGEMAHRVYQGKEREKETKKEREKKREKRKREREKEGERQREKGERKKREKKERRERKTEKEKKEVSMYIRTYYTHQWHFSYLQFLCSMPPFLMWPISSLHSLLDFQCKNHMDIHRYMYYLSVSVIKLNAS